MGIFPAHVRDQVIIPACRALGDRCLSPAAVNLLLGTCAQESGFGEFGLVQRPSGIALGLFQVEPATYYDVWNRAPADMKATAREIIPASEAGKAQPDPRLMVTNLMFAAVVARMKSWLARPALPAADDQTGLWNYYKVWWNSTKGAATRDQWDRNWIKYAMAVAVKPDTTFD
jgi:hypothetical protein